MANCCFIVKPHSLATRICVCVCVFCVNSELKMAQLQLGVWCKKRQQFLVSHSPAPKEPNLKGITQSHQDQQG